MKFREISIFMYFSVVHSCGLFTCSLCGIIFSPSPSPVSHPVERLVEVDPAAFSQQRTSLNTQGILMLTRGNNDIDMNTPQQLSPANHKP